MATSTISMMERLERECIKDKSRLYLCTYFIADKTRQLVKIGKSKTPYSRLRNLQTANGGNLTIELLLPVDCGNLEVLSGCKLGDWREKQLHKRFKNSHLRGEWFHFSPEIKKFIKDMIAEGA
jgi:hypothetical protein